MTTTFRSTFTALLVAALNALVMGLALLIGTPAHADVYSACPGDFNPQNGDPSGYFVQDAPCISAYQAGQA